MTTSPPDPAAQAPAQGGAQPGAPPAPIRVTPAANPSPEDFPGEVEMSLVDHLEELRRRILRSLLAVVAAAVEERSAAYLARYGQQAIAVGAVLFDRQRLICARGPLGVQLLEAFQD